MQRYGLPQRLSGEPFDHWARIVRSAGKRFCDRTVTNRLTRVFNPSDQRSQNWAGNIADEPNFLDPDTYSEVDTDFYVPCVNSGQSDAQASFWVGLGGWYTGNLVQTGVNAHRLYVANYGWYTVYEAWVENLAYAPNPAENDVFPVSCGDHMYIQTGSGGSNCNYITDLTSANTSYQCYGPGADQLSAEGIAERPCIGSPGNCSFTLLANFVGVTFGGVGITDNGNYEGMDQVNHDYTNMWSDDFSHTLASVGPIYYDGNEYPPDDYTVFWQNYS